MSPYKVGDILYPAFKPQQAGVVISATEPDEFGFQRITIRDLKGREHSDRSHMFSDFAELIESHRRKYENMKAVYDQLVEKRG